MSRAARGSLVAALAVLLVVGLLREEDRSTSTPTTFGTIPGGYRAVFELLSELGVGVERTFDPLEELAPGAPLWSIEPRGICRSEEESEEARPSWDGDAWVAAGGTAVVFLPHASGDGGCETSPRDPLPARDAAPTGAPPHGKPEPPPLRLVTGDLVGAPRELRISGLRTFDEAGTWRVRADVTGHPFVLERDAGAGRIVVVADAAFVANANLDRADAAPLAFDLVRAYGAPRFDERGLGPHRRPTAAAYLVASPAAAVFVGLALVAVLFAWQGNSLPPRAPGDDERPAPRLDTFVDSLAALYARSRDHARVLARYRDLTAARLRRHFGMSPETPLRVLIDRLAQDRRAAPEGLSLLAEGVPVTDPAGLRAAVRTLDQLVHEVAR